MAEGDIVWRRPTPGAETPVVAVSYTGPPAGVPADPGWQPTRETPLTAPRPLPPTDHDAIDNAEYRARWVTYAIGFSALAVLTFVICARMF